VSMVDEMAAKTASMASVDLDLGEVLLNNVGGLERRRLRGLRC
jgi:hypothetical protein